MNLHHLLLPLLLCIGLNAQAEYFRDTVENNDGTYSVGRVDHRFRWQGKWKVFENQSNELVRKEHYRDGHLHGRRTELHPHKVSRYRYGIPDTACYNSKGQRYVFLYSYGLFNYHDPTAEIERFACVEVPIANCVVNRRIEWRAARHNFFVGIYQSFRFGPGWKKGYFAWRKVPKQTPSNDEL